LSPLGGIVTTKTLMGIAAKNLTASDDESLMPDSVNAWGLDPSPPLTSDRSAALKSQSMKWVGSSE
jgi:hypothetical protein